MAGLLTRHDYAVVSDEDLLDAAAAPAMLIHHRRSLAQGRVMVADRT
jgi:hypothetical protein